MTPFEAVDDGHQWIATGRYEDIDAQAAQLIHYGQHYEQLSRGRFEGCFASFFLRDDISVHFERTNRLLVQSGRSPADRYTAMFLAADSPACTINGERFCSDDIIFWPPEYAFEVITPASMTVCVVNLARRFLPVPDRGKMGDRIVRNGHATARLRRFVMSGLAEIQQNTCVLENAAATADFAASFGSSLPPALQSTDVETLGGTANVKRMTLYTLARNTIHRSLADGVGIAALCAELRVSRRCIEKLFVSMLGTSPARYIRALRLNEIRRSLLAEGNSARSIGDIAARWGIWHWSRFSKEYQLMFGESPSQTRQGSLRSSSVARVRPRQNLP